MAVPVHLHLYDLTQGMASALSPILLGKQLAGIWHTGLVVHNKEHFFGYGISSTPAGRTPFGQPDMVICLGNTEVPHDMVEGLLADLRSRYRPQDYNLIYNNCNHFTSELSQLLTGEDIPEFVRTQAQEVMETPLGQQFAPMILQLEGITSQAHASGFGAAPAAPAYGATAPLGAPPAISAVVPGQTTAAAEAAAAASGAPAAAGSGSISGGGSAGGAGGTGGTAAGGVDGGASSGHVGGSPVAAGAGGVGGGSPGLNALRAAGEKEAAAAAVIAQAAAGGGRAAASGIKHEAGESPREDGGMVGDEAMGGGDEEGEGDGDGGSQGGVTEVQQGVEHLSVGGVQEGLSGAGKPLAN